MRILAVVAALPLIACSYAAENDGTGVAGTGSGNSRSYDVAGFTKVALRGSDDIDVRVGPAFSVRAEGDPEVLEYLKIERDGDTLKVGRRNRMGFNWGKRTAKVCVTMPRINEGMIAGSGNMVIDRADGAKFAAASAGSGRISIAALAVGEAEFSIAGSGGVSAGGTARSVKVNIAGSGDVGARALKAGAAEVSVAGSGNVTLDVNGDAKVAIMGSGDVDLGASARCTTSKMGAGSVRCGG